MENTVEGATEITRPSHLVVTMFGIPAVSRGGEALEFSTQHAFKALFCLLSTPEGSLEAETLGERLWPDAPLSRLGQRLSTMTWQLRRALGEDAWRVVRHPGRFEFLADGVEIDLQSARQSVLGASPVDPDAVGMLNRAVLVPWADEPWVRDIGAENERILRQLERG